MSSSKCFSSEKKFKMFLFFLAAAIVFGGLAIFFEGKTESVDPGEPRLWYIEVFINLSGVSLLGMGVILVGHSIQLIWRRLKKR